MNKEDYNNEPVFYCKHCLSLAIIDAGIVDFCKDCGGADIGVATLEEYDELHLKKFGNKLFY